jgi:hypothetical protein
MYEEPHRMAFSNRNQAAFRLLMMFMIAPTSHSVTIIFNSFASFIANPARNQAKSAWEPGGKRE